MRCSDSFYAIYRVTRVLPRRILLFHTPILRESRAVDSYSPDDAGDVTVAAAALSTPPLLLFTAAARRAFLFAAGSSLRYFFLPLLLIFTDDAIYLRCFRRRAIFDMLYFVLPLLIFWLYALYCYTLSSLLPLRVSLMMRYASFSLMPP